MVKVHGTVPKGRLIQGLYKPIHGNCAIYFTLVQFGQINPLPSSNIVFGARRDIASELVKEIRSDPAWRQEFFS